MNGIHFQDEDMKCKYVQFLEILFVAAICKLNDTCGPLYAFLVYDRNGGVKLLQSGWLKLRRLHYLFVQWLNHLSITILIGRKLKQ